VAKIGCGAHRAGPYKLLLFCAPRMFEQWRTDEDMSHGFLVPIVVLWIVWRERGRWRVLPAQPSCGDWRSWYPPPACSSPARSAWACSPVHWPFSFPLQRGALPGGLGWLRALAFPLLLAVFMLPKLAIVYNQATLPLQLLASRIAAAS